MKLLSGILNRKELKLPRFILSLIEEEVFSGRFDKKTVVITLGEKGCIYRKGGELYNFPAYKTKAIDTTGAGDIFHGAFIFSLAKGYDFVKSIKFSSVCASLSVEKIGGRESIPE
ncbi:MAG: carbohydrate kinase family protein, partial [Peptostreptococcaceae bacterium]